MIRIEMDPGIAGKMDRIGKAINKALVFTLTDSAKYAKAGFIEEIKAKIDRPSPFTLRSDGYGVIFAKFDDPKPFSMLLIKDKQSAYENYLIGRRFNRGIADPGASKKHVWVPGQRPGEMVPGEYSIRQRFTAFGGIPDEYTQDLYHLSFLERSRGISRSQGRTDFAGNLKKAVYSQGGVFYGTIKGRIGFWARPKRTAAIAGAKLERSQKYNQQSYRLGQRDAKGRFISTGRGDFDTRGRKFSVRADARIKNKGIPFLLLKTGTFNDGRTSTHHRKILDYDGVVKKAHQASLAKYPERLRKQMLQI